MKTNTYAAMQWKEIKHKIAKTRGKKVDVKGYRRLLALHMRGPGKSREQIKEVFPSIGAVVERFNEVVKKLTKDVIKSATLLGWIEKIVTL